VTPTPGNDVRVFGDLSELSLHAAQSVTAVINDAVGVQGRCAIAVSGGDTPRGLYRHLATTFRDEIPWARVHIFWVDERYVPADDPGSNYRMAKETLLDHVPCPAANVHPMLTSFVSADDSALDYERSLRAYFSDGEPRFDLAVLGLGADGHTASLFPGTPALGEQERWVVAVHAPVLPSRRLTLTFPVLTRSAVTCVLASGGNKSTAFEHALSEPLDSTACPAARLRSTRGALTWWVDRPTLGSSGVILR
jgi:6-phosphogluconolactonase